MRNFKKWPSVYMPVPTLLRPGFLIPQPGTKKSEAEKLKQQVPVEYIMKFIGDRVSLRGAAPKVKPKGIGDHVLVVEASTGSGKSTTMISYLYRTFHETVPKNIVVTQPRVLTAVDIASGLPKWEPLLELDRNVGYSTGSFKRPITEKGIIYMTVETLVQQYLGAAAIEDFANMYGFIVIDEIHERDLATDNCLYLLKKMLGQLWDKPECPFIVLTSATFEKRIFMDYFDVPKTNYVLVEGQTYHKEIHFPPFNMRNYSAFAVEQAKHIHLSRPEEFSDPFCDILIFMSTGPEIKEAVEMMHKFNAEIDAASNPASLLPQIEKNIDAAYAKEDVVAGGAAAKEKHYVLPIALTRTTYDASADDYRNLDTPISNLSVPIYDKSGKVKRYERASRRIYISTNIAETGVTIDTLKHCIDTGFYFSLEFNPEFGCAVSVRKPVTTGMATQRKGRVGRVAAGDWWPAFTEKTLGAMQKDQFSQILVSEVTDNLLTILIGEQAAVEAVVPPLHKGPRYRKHVIQDTDAYYIEHGEKLSLSALDFIELPSADSLCYSLEKLHILGFITDDIEITPFGYYANKIRFISLELKRMIFSGYSYGVSIMQLITIAAIVYKGAIAKKPFNYLDYSDEKFNFYRHVVIADDFISQLLMYEYIQRKISTELVKAYKKGQQPKFDLKKWLAEREIEVATFLKIVEFRDELVHAFTDLGLDPMAGDDEPLLETFTVNVDAAIARVRLIKKCIYEGYRLNLATWFAAQQSFVMVHKKIPVLISSPLIKKINAEQQQPNYIILSNYSISQDRMGFVRAQSREYVSVLDGHVQPDMAFSL